MKGGMKLISDDDNMRAKDGEKGSKGSSLGDEMQISSIFHDLIFQMREKRCRNIKEMRISRAYRVEVRSHLPDHLMMLCPDSTDSTALSLLSFLAS